MTSPPHRPRVIVSYTGTQSFLSSPNWNQLYNHLISHLPLRNIHWKSPSRPSLKTIQELDVTLTPLDKIRDDLVSQVPTSILDKPLLNLYVLYCEDGDADGYRASLKKQIKDWHSLVTTRKNQEWLILQVVRPDTRTQGGKFFALKGSVSDKVRSDFNTEKKDRCTQLNWTPGIHNPAAWGEFVNRLKDGIITAFDTAISLREDEVKRSDNQRQLPGWNFCTFFILKESLATSFQGVNLPEDALSHYDELEVSFYQVLKEKNLSWFGTLISPDPTDDAAPLLSISKKPYRDLILANTISVFDFRMYLLARQCELLAELGRITEVCTKVGAFLGAFGRRLREVEDTLPKNFVESWTYSSAQSVVEQCDIWAASLQLEASRQATFSAGKGELLELARNQLDIIGVQVGHLPTHPPFSMVFPDAPTVPQTKSTGTISNSQIVRACDSPDVFYSLYVDTTNRAIELYAKAGRRKFALKLHGSLAALDLHRGNHDAALTTYSSLPAHYAPHMWTSLESLMLSRALDIHSTLSRPKDREWMHILLAFLKTYVETSGVELLISEEDKATYAERLLNEMALAAANLDEDLIHPDHPILRVRLLPETARIARSKDGCLLDVTVTNPLRCPLPISEVSVVLTGKESERLKFVAPVEQLSPGPTTVTLFCPAAFPGTYLLEMSEARISRLVLQWPQTRKGPSKTLRAAPTHPTLVIIPKDFHALDVTIHQPSNIVLGRPPGLLVKLHTGRNDIAKAVIKLTVASTTFQYTKVTLEAPASTEFDSTEDAINLANLARDMVISILVPHSDVSALQALRVQITVDYLTKAEPQVDRTLRLTRTVTTVLPISVNVEDFFRGKRLFSKFTVSTTSNQHVRVAEARLNPPMAGVPGLTIVGCSSKNKPILTITPSQSANYLFHVDSASGPIREPLTLSIQYRLLREEVQHVVESTVEEFLVQAPTIRELGPALIHHLLAAVEKDISWVELYTLSGELRISSEIKDLGDLSEHLQLLQEKLAQHRHPSQAKGSWRNIEIPVDVPNMNIVAATAIKVISSDLGDPALYAGQPVSAVLNIHTMFHWGSSDPVLKGRKYAMQFDVEELVKDWLVSGKKRGDFLAEDDKTFSTPITLIALHHGELSLPKVAVAAAPVIGEMTMGSLAIPSTEAYQAHGAEKVLVLPRGGRSTFLVEMG